MKHTNIFIKNHKAVRILIINYGKHCLHKKKLAACLRTKIPADDPKTKTQISDYIGLGRRKMKKLKLGLNKNKHGKE